MPISSLFLRSSLLAKLAVLSFLASHIAAVETGTYQLAVTYTGDSFFDDFDFFTGPDLGFVNYNDYTTAYDNGLVSTDPMGINYISVDTTSTFAGSSPVGRNAVRITSKREFTHGLFITEILNIPGGVCGVSSTFGTVAPDSSASIDIISGINDQTYNDISLSTSSACNTQTGSLLSSDCSDGGCVTTDDSDPLSYGTAFNTNGGGISATQWDSDFIRVWFWASGSPVPEDILTGTPDPTTWGLPVADFEGCNIDNVFMDNKIVFDTNFCTAIAEAAFASDSTCTAQADTCRDFVAGFPGAFEQSYWAIGYISVYEFTQDIALNPDITPAASSTAAVTSAAASSTTSATSAGSTVIDPKAGVYSYYGCVADIDIRLLQGSHTAYDEMTLESCAADCTAYSFFGTEFGRECYCGDEFSGSANVQPDGGCYMFCKGDALEFCGGPMLLSVYSLYPQVGASSTATASSTVANPTSTEVGGASTSVFEAAFTTLSAGTSSPNSAAQSPNTVISGSAATTSIHQAVITTSLPAAFSTATPTPSLPILPDVISPPATSSPPPSFPTQVLNPLQLGSWDLLGCYSSSDGFSTFTAADLFGAANSLEVCTDMCATQSFLYAGLYDDSCYCASSLGPSSTPSFSANCNILCPGNPTEACGGNFPLPRRSLPTRQNGGNPGLVLLTIYVYQGPVAGTSSSGLAAPSSILSNNGTASPPSSSIPAGAGATSSSIPAPITLSGTAALTYSLVLSTIFTTKIYTITSCAPTITNCPARIGSLTTETISLYTTWCPFSLVLTPAAAPNPTPFPTPAPASLNLGGGGGGEVYTTVVVTSYVDVCPGSGGLTAISMSQTQILPIPLSGSIPIASIAMITTTKTFTSEGMVSTVTLTIPSPTPASPAPAVIGAAIATGPGITTQEGNVAAPPSFGIPGAILEAVKIGGTTTLTLLPIAPTPSIPLPIPTSPSNPSISVPTAAGSVYQAGNSTVNAPASGVGTGVGVGIPKQSVLSAGANRGMELMGWRGLAVGILAVFGILVVL